MDKKRGQSAAERRRRIRYLKIRRAVFLAVCFLLAVGLTAGGVFAVKGIAGLLSGGRDNEQLEKLAAATLPEYVDVQLIDKGNARSGKSLDRVSDIVIHYVGNPETTAQNNRDYFSKASTEVCSHFVVGLEGEVIQCLPLTEKSAASNNRNGDTISVEVCHPDASGEFNEATYDTLVRLTAWLLDICGLTEENVIRHYDITGKLCPLYYVEHEDAWKRFKADVGNELN